MFAPIVVNHLMVIIVRTVITLKCSIDMAKLVIVKFEGNPKEYAFLTYLNSIKTGDRVMDRRYDKPFVVKSADFNFNNATSYKGYVLKWLTEETVLWIATEYQKPKEEQMEKRNISISLEQAREWYHNDCGLLRRLALSAFTEKELKEPQTFEEVMEAMDLGSLEVVATGKAMKGKYSNAISSILNKERVNIRLAIIAEYLNEGWKPGVKEKKFFIAQGTSYSPSAVRLENGFYVNFHETVRYPGIVYFKTQEDAVKAFNMMKNTMNAWYRY